MGVHHVRHLFVRELYGIHGRGQAVLTRGRKFATQDRLGRRAFGVIGGVRGIFPGDAAVHLGRVVRPILWLCMRIIRSRPRAGISPVHRRLEISSTDELLVPWLGIRIE